MYLYAFYQARDGGMQFPRKIFLINKLEFGKEEYFTQIKDCYNELIKTPIKINPFINALLKTKGVRPIISEDIVKLMVEKYGYQTVENKHKFKAWIEDTKITKDINSNTFMTILEKDISEGWVENYL